jgi:hypothetical protein
MKTTRTLAVLFLAVLLGNCASLPDQGKAAVLSQAESGFETVRDMLPGVYSNFAWAEEQGSESPVTDLRIRQLKTDGEPVFLFEQYLRGQDIYSYDLYWLKLNHAQRRAELYFARLDENELSLPMRDTLSIAWNRVLPGCVMPLEHEGNDRFTGATDPATCIFEDPLRGQTSLLRHLSFDADTMTIETGLRDAGNRKSDDDRLLELQKHRTFTGWASFRTEPAQQDEPGDWQLSQVFQLRDDGRVNQLYDQQMSLLDFGLQLARLNRIEGEPPYYKLSVINLANGQTQAYQWFGPGSTDLNLNLDWFQTNLAPARPEERQP